MGRADIAKLAVRPPAVVDAAEVFNNYPSLGEGPELFPVQAFIAEAAVKRFHKAVLPGAGGIDVDGLDLRLR
jgi:hypothetical protein